jgi:hypothetical protein
MPTIEATKLMTAFVLLNKCPRWSRQCGLRFSTTEITYLEPGQGSQPSLQAIEGPDTVQIRHIRIIQNLVWGLSHAHGNL